MIRVFRSLVLAISIFRSRDFIYIKKDKPRRPSTKDIKPQSKSDMLNIIPMLFLPSESKIKQAGFEEDTAYANSELQIGI